MVLCYGTLWQLTLLSFNVFSLGDASCLSIVVSPPYWFARCHEFIKSCTEHEGPLCFGCSLSEVIGKTAWGAEFQAEFRFSSKCFSKKENAAHTPFECSLAIAVSEEAK